MIAHSGGDHFATVLLAASMVVAYGLAWLRQRRPDPRRLWAWISGVVALIVASSPWLESVAADSFTGHMLQHLLLIGVAAPLLVLAEPLRTATRSGLMPTTATGRRLGSWWHRWGVVVAPVLFVVVLFLTHLSSIYDRALQHRWIHESEHAAYLLGALAMWAVVLGASQTGAVLRIAAVFGVGAAGSVLGLVLLSAPEPLIPTYEHHLGTAEALDDQRAAAALMWISGMATTVPLLVIAVWRWASAEDRATRRLESLSSGQPGEPASP
jgi:putative membrane protein